MNSDIKVSGLATYHNNASDYLFVAHDETMDVNDSKFQQRGSIALSGIPELSIEGGLSVLQSSVDGYPFGAIAFRL